MTAEYKVRLPLLTPEQAAPPAAEALRASQKAMGMVPNMYAAMANVPGVLLTYQSGYAHFRAESGFTPVEQEVVFLTISRENGCEYCVSAHSFVADKMSGVPTEVTDAIRERRKIADTKLEALSAFTSVMFRSRGLPSKAEAEAFLNAGYGEKHMLGIILAVAVKTLSNYSNHLFHTPVDEAFASRRWRKG